MALMRRRIGCFLLSSLHYCVNTSSRGGRGGGADRKDDSLTGAGNLELHTELTTSHAKFILPIKSSEHAADQNIRTGLPRTFPKLYVGLRGENTAAPTHR
ncbi:hypothetical protein M011DRAFT_351095 [Sporormia fimetaria CBS 119925]|uniref:Secreted protein n=1 Tax=Sporormia fimetaria CBS 119925 TaxID=1340428 RepID=A0A6A6VH33_9PLEO|nr:hypothetical protein M011DRAFT_351095 [Sporormia fimetaria CBS 119925]